MVDIFGDGSVLDPIHSFVDCEQRHKEPFSGNDRVSEPVSDPDVHLRWFKDPVDQVFQLGAIDVVQIVGRDDLDIGHQE